MRANQYLAVSLSSITLIALELAWTRILSAEFFYAFAFLVLSLAVLGLGLGALSVRLFPSLGKPENLGWLLSGTGLMSLVGPVAIFQLGLKFSEMFSSWLMMGKLLLAVLLLGSAFVFGGMVLASVFRLAGREITRLYMIDLLGAGLGVVVAIWLMNLIGTPAATFVIAIPVLLAAVICSRGIGRAVPAALMVGAVALAGYGSPMLAMEREELATVSYTHWDAVSKLKIYDFAEDYRGLNIDNLANSPCIAFDGNWNRPDSERFEFNYPVDYLIGLFDSCTFLSLGSGGGVDVLQALQEGATEIHAVEVNPHINHLMTEGSLAEFTGHIYDDPRVTVVTEDGRAYVRRFENKFDLIYSVSSNTWAALASGSFALAENYLFTTEAFEDYWRALSDSGFMMMEHQFYMPRLVTEAMTALEAMGVEDVTSHIAVYDLVQRRRNILLLSKRPLDDTLRYHALFDLDPEVYEEFHLLYPATDSTADNPINQIVTRGWDNVSDSIAIDLSPATDDRPFIAQLGLWKNFNFEALEQFRALEIRGFPAAKLLIVIILGVCLLLIVPLNLIPYWRHNGKLRAAPWLYFFAIGVAFMAIEVILIQQFSLLVGPSAYSVATILFTLLIGSGLGSMAARRFSDHVPFVAIALWVLLDILAFGWFVDTFGGLEIGWRVLIAALAVLPLGFFMGMPFPKAALRVGELVDWGFAVNGAASVIGSVLIILIAFSYGFTIALLAAVVVYLLAWMLISNKSAW